MAKRGRKKGKAVDDKGYLDKNKDNFTDYKVIAGNKITMEGVSGNIYAIPIDKAGKAGEGRLLKSGENHEFEGASHVIEVPELAMAQAGVNTGNFPNRTHNNQSSYNGFGSSILDGIQSGGNAIANKFEQTMAENMQLFDSSVDWLKSFGGEEEVAQREATTGMDFHEPNGIKTSTPELSKPAGITLGEGYKSVNTVAEHEAYLMEDENKQQSHEELTKGIPKFDGEEEWAGEGEEDSVKATEKIQFHNQYGGVDIPTAAQTLGASFSYDGEKKGANTMRGIASGAKLLAGIGRNVASGYGQNKRNQFALEEYNKKQKQATVGNTVELQKGGEVTSADLLAGAVTTGNPTEAPNVEVEGGEHIMDNQTGQVQEVVGNKHSEGGEKMNLEDHKILTDFTKIGAEKAKAYKDEYGINIKAKDTFSTVMDRVLKKTGYTSITEKLTQVIESTEKEKNRVKGTEDEATEGINMQHLSGKINDLSNSLKPLEQVKASVFERLYNDQQSDKSPEELAQEEGQMQKGGEKETMGSNLRREGEEVEERETMGWTLKENYEEGAPKDKPFTALEILKRQFTEFPTSIDEFIQRSKGMMNGEKGASDPEAYKRIEEWEKWEASKVQNREKGGLVKAEGGVDTGDTSFNKEKSKERFVDFVATARQLGYRGEVDENAENLDAEAAKLQKYMVENHPEVAAEYAKKNRITHKGLEILKAEFPYLFEQAGLDINKKSPDFSDEELAKLTTVATELDVVDNSFWLDQFNDGVWRYRSPQIAKSTKGLHQGFPETDITAQLLGEQYKPLTKAQGNLEKTLEGTPEGAVEPVTGEEEADGRPKKEGTGDKIMNLPNQYIMPPSSMQPHRLSEITPREAEKKLISSDTQIEEINRQFLAAKTAIDSLPDSQRRSALAQLNTQTQQSINQVMAQTNRDNAQIAGGVEENNIRRQSEADQFNERGADDYERKTLVAKDNTENDVRNYFNAQNKANVANYNTVQNINLSNAMYDNFQYTGDGRIKQTGTGLDSEQMAQITAYNLAVTQAKEADKKKKKTETKDTKPNMKTNVQTAKRGRSTK